MIKELHACLGNYRAEKDKELLDKEGLEYLDMIVSTVERLETAFEKEEYATALLEVYTFSRQVSDYYGEHPKSIWPLCESVSNVERKIKALQLN